MKLFFDNNTPPALAETFDGYLKHLGMSAAHIRDLPCGRHATDIEWIDYLAQTREDWLVFTGDLRIQRNRAERLAFRQARLRGFILARGYQTIPVHRRASFLLWRWTEIEGLTKIAAPFLFELPASRSGGIRSLAV